MLKRVHISGYKSLVDLDFTLKPLTVLFGPNAAGKSNFLDALQLLSRMATSRTLKDAFDPPYRGKPLESFTFGPHGIADLLKQLSTSFTMEADIELSPGVVESVNHRIRELKHTPTPREARPAGGENGVSFVREKLLRYRIQVEIIPQSGILRVADESLAALNARGEPTGKRQPFLKRMGNRLHLRMEGQAHPSYHERYLDHTILSLPLYPPHYPHLVALREELASWFFFYLEPRERMRAATAVKEVRQLGPMGDELAGFVNTLQAVNERQFHGLEKALHLVVPSVTGIKVGVNPLGETELHLREGGELIPARLASDGTLRALGLFSLSCSAAKPALIAIEEPENGIHPGRLRLVAEYLETQAELGNSQLIVTTHSPILPDLVPSDALYVCRKRDGKTELTPYVELGELLRRTDSTDSTDSQEALDAKESVPVSERIVRGDFDA